nr:MAG TPA: hypothetical protein [Caudoviricetes sp.]
MRLQRRRIESDNVLPLCERAVEVTGSEGCRRR